MNINTFLSHFVALTKRILFILLLFTLSRLIFALSDIAFFKPLNYSLLIKSFFFGIRFDFIAIFYLNIIFIFLHLFAFHYIENHRFQKILKGLFIFVNSLMLLFNFIDIIYFQYTGKRSGWELLEMLYRSTDTTGMIPVYI